MRRFNKSAVVGDKTVAEENLSSDETGFVVGVRSVENHFYVSQETSVNGYGFLSSTVLPMIYQGAFGGCWGRDNQAISMPEIEGVWTWVS